MKPYEHDGADCRPVIELLARIGEKWTVMVVTRLSGRQMRFSELKRDIGLITQKMLTQTLRGLEKDGFVERIVTPSIPPRVDYRLTELGDSLLTPLHALGAWAMVNQSRVTAARQKFLGANLDV